MFNQFKNYFFDKKISYIKNYQIPLHVLEDFHEKTQIQQNEQILLIIKGLKLFFIMCLLNKGNKIPVVMSSKYIDELWHSFILDTKEYQKFCRHFYHDIIHHIPAKKSIITLEMIENNQLLWKKMQEVNIIDNHLKGLQYIDAIIEQKSFSID